MDEKDRIPGENILSALIGLVGAVANNGRTEQTDRVIREAVMGMNEEEREEEILQRIYEVKNNIAPDCAVCKNPCGNTSDYDMTQFYEGDKKILIEKKKLIGVIRNRLKISEKISDDIYRGIAYIGYQLEPDEYQRLRKEL